jgi:glycosyltransferase involved in cell wall biosynthesis
MKIKVKYVLSHPIQYIVPLIQRLAEEDTIDMHAVFATDAGAKDYFDPGFSREVRWDRPLLEGYRYSILKPGAKIGRKFMDIRGHGISAFLSKDDADMVITHGWSSYMAVTTMLTAFARKIPVLNRSEIQRFTRGRPLAGRLRPVLLYPLLRRMDGLMAIGTLNREFYLEAGVKPERIYWTPYSIDTRMFLETKITQEDRLREEEKIGLRPGSFRVIFCGKLIHDKRPYDIIEAVAQMPSRESVEAVFVGDGELMPMLKRLAEEKKVKAHFLGFRNQTELPLLYSLADVMALPSGHEPWGLVVNEAMTMGLPAIVSDVVGCGPDLAKNGESGYICPKGDVPAISEALEKMASSPDLLQRLKKGALERIKDFSMDRTIEGYLEAIHGVLGRRPGL